MCLREKIMTCGKHALIACSAEARGMPQSPSSVVTTHILYIVGLLVVAHELRALAQKWCMCAIQCEFSSSCVYF